MKCISKADHQTVKKSSAANIAKQWNNSSSRAMTDKNKTNSNNNVSRSAVSAVESND